MPYESSHQQDEAYLVETNVQGVLVRGFIERDRKRYTATLRTISPVDSRHIDEDVQPHIVRRIVISGGYTWPVNGHVELGNPLDGVELKYYDPPTGSPILRYEPRGIPMSLETWKSHQRQLGEFIEALGMSLRDLRYNEKPFSGPTYPNLRDMGIRISSMIPEGIPTTSSHTEMTAKSQ